MDFDDGVQLVVQILRQTQGIAWRWCTNDNSDKQCHSTYACVLGNKAATLPAATDGWVQCEEEACGKWRILPPHVGASELPDRFVCSMAHWLPGIPSCTVPGDDENNWEDFEDSDDSDWEDMEEEDSDGGDDSATAMPGSDARGVELLHTSVFISPEVERLMRFRTWHTDRNYQTSMPDILHKSFFCIQDCIAAEQLQCTWTETDEPQLDDAGLRARLPLYTAASRLPGCSGIGEILDGQRPHKSVDFDLNDSKRNCNELITQFVRIGAFASRTLAESEFIGEYTGEILLTKDLNNEERSRSCYVFDLGGGFAIDARPRGNKTRRMVRLCLCALPLA